MYVFLQIYEIKLAVPNSFFSSHPVDLHVMYTVIKLTGLLSVTTDIYQFGETVLI